ncbi:PREDICTED: LOW QUALITY PROTEIN: ankyrin repeat domain-containing protein SOWAHA-like, partial [Branchiostoma belcheri]|uniref:LOW QUALITY PROTEIN: ankyrin repeat domain-containing protein SOWAHA-like n=1 Tax=Branchiostoma belcheri TaxID=7741 RepID=A0A6P4YHI8_BRABE
LPEAAILVIQLNMADYEFTFDGVKQFIADRGGRVRNVELVTHFRQHLNDPARKAEAREQFKDFVNNVAVIRQEEGEKFLVLKKKYREPTAQVSRVRPLAVEELEYTGEEPQNNIPYQPPDQPSSYLAFQEPPLPPPPGLASPVRRDWDVPAPPAEHEAGWQPPYQQPDLVRRQPSFNDYNQQQPYDEPEIIRRQPSFNQPPSPYERNDEPLPVNRQSSFKEPVSVARKPSFEKAITHNQFPPHEPPPSPLDDAHSPTFKRPSPPAQSQNGGPKSELQLPRSDSSSRMETGSSRSDTVSIRSDTASISEKGEAEDDGYGSNVSSVAKRVHFAEYDEYLILHQDFVPSSQLYYHHTHRPQLMLDVLEKEWMLKAAVGNVSALRRLLSQDPNLASKKALWCLHRGMEIRRGLPGYRNVVCHPHTVCYHGNHTEGPNMWQSPERRGEAGEVL